jgi:hypothetical protein
VKMKQFGYRRLAFIVLLASGIGFAPQRQPPVWSLRPEVRILSSDSIPQLQLTTVTDLVAAPDGFIFALETIVELGCIRVYDSSGRFVHSFGRLGDGPHEFSRNVQLLGAAGDSVLVHDHGRYRVHMFRRNGTFIRTQQLPVDGGALRGYLSPERLLVEKGYWSGRIKDSLAFVIADSVGREIAQIAVQRTIPPPLRVVSVGLWPQPYISLVQTAQDPRGHRALVAIPSSYWGGQPGQVKLVLVNRQGVQAERVVNVGAERVTEGLRAMIIRKYLDPASNLLAARGVTRSAAERQMRESFVDGPYLREIEGAMLGSDGSVWLKRLIPDDWIVVSPSGSIVGRVTVPSGMRVYQASLEQVWGVVRDADGVPVIVRYRLSSP